jgi:mersacidin/lichenicidin family type 2 lantibiotic
MTHMDIIHAWKDEEHRLSLSEEERALLPAHPAGLIELTQADLGKVSGGWWGLGTDQYGWGLYLIHCYEDNDQQQSVCKNYRVL